MKKYLALLMLLPALAFAQKNDGNFAEITEQFLSKGNKKIEYELTISEGDALIFKSDFAVMNGERLTLFKREIQKEKETVNGKKLSLGKESLAEELELAEEKNGDIEIIRLKSEITRETNNIVSNFAVVVASLNAAKKETKKSSVDEELPNGTFREDTPFVESVEKRISIAHQKNKDIVFTSEDKTFFIKAKY